MLDKTSKLPLNSGSIATTCIPVYQIYTQQKCLTTASLVLTVTHAFVYQPFNFVSIVFLIPFSAHQGFLPWFGSYNPSLW